MDKEIKKKLASNWFKLLQNIICDDIEKIENKKIKKNLLQIGLSCCRTQFVTILKN